MKLRVWHNAQVGTTGLFYVPVKTVEEGKRVMDTLSAYDEWQYRNNIKPDYCNACGLEMYDEDDHEWVDWYVITEEGDYFDRVDEYLENNDDVQGFNKQIFEQINQIKIANYYDELDNPTGEAFERIY